MPQGEGTYGSKVGRPSKKRTSYVNDNNWFQKLLFGSESRQRYMSQAHLSGIGGSKKYGQSSVMDKDRKTSMTDAERGFRKEGGIESLAYRARGITDNTYFKTHQTPTDSGIQAAATQFRSLLSKDVQNRIDTVVGREVTNQRQAQMHMGEPSEYEARYNKKLFGTSMLTKKK